MVVKTAKEVAEEAVVVVLRVVAAAARWEA